MSNIYLYADETSLDVLANEQQKLVLIGGDFGYGNFGDVLQHLNAIRLVKETRRYATVSVMAANAIGFAAFPDWAQSAYGTDAILYVADYPLILDENSPRLKAVGEIRNLAAVHLYGGGFLNHMWGDFVLSVASHFLRLAPGISYFVSGQQITDPYQEKVTNHIKEFEPLLFGVRDELSQQLLLESGFEPHFSFDDATEALQDLTQCTRLRRGEGLLLHLNSSDYTANLSLQAELSALKATSSATEPVTIFQAFRDTRQEVVDTLETIKKLDAQFPFYDTRLINLTSLIFGNSGSSNQQGITGQFGYSCSYHVALWLQLAGIPCWLRSSNPFYDQKSRALQVTQELEEFIREPKLADHGMNLERRSSWRSLLSDALLNVAEVNNSCSIPDNSGGPAPWPFLFKGTPTLQERLTESESQRAHLAARVSEAQSERDILIGRINALTAQITEIGHEVHQQRARAEIAESNLQSSQIEIANLVRQTSILPEHQTHFAESTLAEIYRSRSWRFTRPLRGITRFVRAGHFDSRGEVGIFAMMQRVARRLPIPAQVRSRIGHFLQRFRRK